MTPRRRRQTGPKPGSPAAQARARDRQLFNPRTPLDGSQMEDRRGKLPRPAGPPAPGDRARRRAERLVKDTVDGATWPAYTAANKYGARKKKPRRLPWGWSNPAARAIRKRYEDGSVGPA